MGREEQLKSYICCYKIVPIYGQLLTMHPELLYKLNPLKEKNKKDKTQRKRVCVCPI